MQESFSEVEENLFSRQLAIYRRENLLKILGFKVFIDGLQGIGLEVAKNLVLNGVKTITLHDNQMVELRDLGSNFYCKENDIAHKSRAQASIDGLRLLNPFVEVNLHEEEEIMGDFLSEFDVVVFTNYYNRRKLIELNEFCRNREKPIGFILGGCLGLYGFTFVDFGRNFLVYEPCDEYIKDLRVVNITNENPAKVTVFYHKLRRLADGDKIKFDRVKGMSELNKKEYNVVILDPHNFTINADTTNYGKYIDDGVIEQVPISQTIDFKSLECSLESPVLENLPPLINPDMNKEGRPEQLHIALNAILYFYDCHQRLPQLLNQQDEDEIVRICKKISMRSSENEERIKCDKIDEDLLRNIARFARTQLSPHASFFGGIIAQEVLKYTGKFMPLRQWLHYETFEVLPDSEVSREICNSRYDDQIIVFGHEFQKKLMNQRVFLVGAGASGCELMKQFALIGACCEKNGMLTCTDNDEIRMHNLSTHFLFNKQDLGKLKSPTSCQKAQKINASLNILPLTLRLGNENQSTFTSRFWEEQDFIISAVDNILTRQFIDSKCVFYCKNFFDCGISGTKSSSQVVIPFRTESYEDSSDPIEASTPIDTLINFPYQVEHTVLLAEEIFRRIFIEEPSLHNKFSENPEEFIKSFQKEFINSQDWTIIRLENLKNVQKFLLASSYKKCVQFTLKKFKELFCDKIVSLLKNFPENLIAGDRPFWSGHKRLPRPIVFNISDETHINFVFATARIYAQIANLPPLKDKNIVTKICQDLMLEDPHFNETDIDETDQAQDEIRFSRLIEKISNEKISPRLQNFNVDENDNSDSRLDFIWTFAILRARNYDLEEISRFSAKLLSERIIPKLSTTVSMVAGILGFEIYKLIAEKKIEDMRNSFCNLAVPMWIFSKPAPPILNEDKEFDPIFMEPLKAIPSGWSKWNKIDIAGPMTVQGIIDYLRRKYGVNLVFLALKDMSIFASRISQKDSNKALRSKLTPEEIYKALKQEDFQENVMELSAGTETIENNVNVNLPLIRYFLKK